MLTTGFVPGAPHVPSEFEVWQAEGLDAVSTPVH
jgi:hypothetical protein